MPFVISCTSKRKKEKIKNQGNIILLDTVGYLIIYLTCIIYKYFFTNFIQFIQSPDDVSRVQEENRKQMKEKDLKVQPFIIMFGSEANVPQEFFLCIDNQQYELSVNCTESYQYLFSKFSRFPCILSITKQQFMVFNSKKLIQI